MTTVFKIQKVYVPLIQLGSLSKRKITQLLQFMHSETLKQNSNSNAHQSQATSFGRTATFKESAWDSKN